jgi:diguanylate cyclase (GGDEF)-like protein/PAS domain S-box-containing protein
MNRETPGSMIASRAARRSRSVRRPAFPLRPMRRWLALLATALLALYGAGPARAYERSFYFQTLDSQDGLAQNSVAVVFQDQQGFMWIATQGGLHRYDGYTLRRYPHDPDRADSLPDNLVTALADADGGRLWVGSSRGGLSLFDPAHNRTLPLPPAVRHAETSVSALLRLPGGALLIATPHGIDRLDDGALKPTTLWSATPRSGGGGFVQNIVVCPDDRIYASTATRVLLVGRAAGGTKVLATTSDDIRAMFCDHGNHLLVGTVTGLWQVDRTSGALVRVWPANNTTVQSTAVDAIAEDHSGRVWLALAGIGLLRLDRNNGQTRLLLPQPKIRGSLPDGAISTLMVDRSGLLWVGTGSHGAAWTDPDGAPFHTVTDLGPSAQRPGSNFVRAFYQTPDGMIWLAVGGDGLKRYDPATGDFESFLDAMRQATNVGVMPQELASARNNYARALAVQAAESADLRVNTIVSNGHGDLLLATSRGIVRFDPAQRKAELLDLPGLDSSSGPAGSGVRTLLRAANGDLWVAPSGSGLIHYHNGQVVRRYHAGNAKQPGLAEDFVISLAEDHRGRIWVGTTAGLTMIVPSTGVIRTFRELPGRNDSLGGHTIPDIFVSKDGTVWVGTFSDLNKLISVDAEGAHFHRYGIEDGLPDGTIYCMVEDSKGGIWFSTNLGIGKLTPDTGHVQSYGDDDGLQGDEYNSGTCLRTHSGALLFGGVHGFDEINPATVKPREYRPPVVITGLHNGDHAIVPPHSGDAVILIPANRRTIDISFAALDYISPRQNRYRYRLLGISDHWSDPSDKHSASYTNLNAGKYTFQVQGISRNGVPGRTAQLSIYVANPWWWSLGMRALYAALLGLVVLAVVLAWRSRRLEELRHQRQLQLREDRLRHALWGSDDEFWDWDLRKDVIFRLGAEGTPGGHREESISAEDWRRHAVHPEDLHNVERALEDHLSGRTDHFEVEHRLLNPAGEWVWVISRGKVVEYDEQGRPLRICGTARDISAMRLAERERRIAAEVIRNMTEAVTVTDLNFRFISVNTAFTRMTGYAEHEVIGHEASILNGSRHSPENYTRLRQVLAETGHWRGELWQRRKDGEEFLSWVELNEVCDASGQRTHLVGVLTDITDRKRAEQELRYLANYDTLTGLPNRALLGERLGAAIIGARRSGNKVAVLFLDLDRFKHVNDSMGHTAGDRTLKAAGTRLRQHVRENDVVARLGGDEFTVVLENLSDERDAEEMAERLIDAFAEPMAVSNTQETVISPSIGIALYPDHGQTPTDLLKCADTAMYQAKERGRNTWAIYHTGMDVRARDRANLVTALRRALERGELSLVYQPKMAIGSNVVTGMEALLRWHSAELGDIAPSVFIPIAEETGQIIEISEFVLATACADLRRFREAGHRHLTMAVNLSAAQLNRSELTLRICEILAEHDIAPDSIELELTESMVMANAEQSVRVLGELKSIGVRLAIDDFGTGYSSLAYLKRLPIDTLKIDQEFVGDVTTDPDDAAITATIITMAHSLQLRVVAEGVETIEQLAFLRVQRCDEIQGHWLSRPLPAERCQEFLEARNRLAASTA